MKKKSVLDNGRKVLVLGAAIAATSSAVADSNVCLSKVRSNANPELPGVIANEFKIVHGIQLDWRKALEVSDDAEGSNCVFATDHGLTVTLPIEFAAATAPNKFTDN